MVAKLSNHSFALPVTGGSSTAPTAPDRAALYSISDLWTAEAPSDTFCAGEVGFLLERHGLHGVLVKMLHARQQVLVGLLLLHI